MPRVVALEVRSRAGLSVHAFADADAFGVEVLVSDRSGGLSRDSFSSLNLGTHVGDDYDTVLENRARLARAVGDDLVIVRQVHGADVVWAHEVTASSAADAIITGHDEALAILVADCVPVALVEESTRRYAVVHAGWRGLVGGVLAATLARFNDPAHVHAFVGPSISGEAYQVGPEVAEHFSGVPRALRAEEADRSRLDLRAVTLHQLLSAGLRDENIVFSIEVTDGGDTFYSDRAQRPCGRFALTARRS